MPVVDGVRFCQPQRLLFTRFQQHMGCPVAKIDADQLSLRADD